MSVPRLRDERLAWLAVHDDLERIVRRSPSGRLTTLFGGRRRARAREQVVSLRMRHNARSVSSDRALGDISLPPGSSKLMVKFSLAVHDVSQRLSADERATLRRTGEVPAWFLGAVRAAAKKA
jgi:hypothetical protein